MFIVTLLLTMGALQPDEEKTQTIETSGIKFDVPVSWKSQKPTSQMRKAQITMGPSEGDKDPAELVLFVFPGGAGSVEANVERWRNQFKDSSGKSPKVESKTVKGKNAEVTRVEASGTYSDPFSKSGPHVNYRLYGAIVITDDTGYFFKMVCPDKTMKAAKDAFDKMLTTIETK
jgi:hypothetical protein